MVTIRELEGAIRECENAPTSYQTCEKLATLYTVLDHIQEPHDMEYSYDPPQVYGDSEFMRAISGQDMSAMWSVMDELMETLLITNPRLYQGVMRKIKGQI